MYSNNHAAHIGRDASNITVVSYNPAVVFFSLFALCLLIMSPMLWILWLIRKDSQEGKLKYLWFSFFQQSKIQIIIVLFPFITS